MSPVSLFYGLESFLIEESCKKRSEQIPVEEWEWNLLILDLEEVPVEQVIQEAETPSFFGGDRLIIAKNASFFTTAKPKRELNHNVDTLIDYLSHPVETTSIVFTVISDKLDKRKKLVKQMEKLASIVKFEPLKGQALLKWVMDRFRKLKVKISREECILFIQTVGADLRLLNQEIQKLALFVGENGVITEQSIQDLIPRTLEDNVFQLTEKIAEQKMAEVWRIWEDLLAQKEEPIKILALITRQFRLLYQTKILSARGLPSSEIAKQLGTHPYPVKLALTQSASFSEEVLQKLLSISINADQAIKTGKIDKVVAVEQVLFSLQGS